MVLDPDRHAVIITADSVISPLGKVRNWKIRSPEDLSATLSHLRLVSLPVGGAVSTAPQCWLVGEIVEILGLRSDADDGDTGAISADLQIRFEEFAASMPEWENRFRSSGGWGYLRHTVSKQGIDLVLEPYGHLNTGSKDHGILGDGDKFDLPDDDHEAGLVLAHRIKSVIELLEVMPAPSASGTAAALQAKINRGRKTPLEATYLSNLDGITDPVSQLPEKPLNWVAARVDADQLAAADQLVVVDARAAHLASAQTDMGWGEAEHVDNPNKATALASSGKIPQGWWKIDVDRVHPILDARIFPLPFPAMPTTEVIGQWVTTATLKFLMLPEGKGGIGYKPRVQQAWIHPNSGRPLREWVAVLRMARIAGIYDAQVGEAPDEAFTFFIKRVYTSYIGRISRADRWKTKASQQHIQPHWNQTVEATTRGKALIYAARIHNEHGLTPLKCATDAWTYLVPAGIDLVGEPSETLGKYKSELVIDLDDEDKALLGAAGTTAAVDKALTAIKKKAKG